MKNKKNNFSVAETISFYSAIFMGINLFAFVSSAVFGAELLYKITLICIPITLFSCLFSATMTK